MNFAQLNLLKETLLSCLREFQELEKDYEWFTTSCINRIEKALKLIQQEQENESTISRR